MTLGIYNTLRTVHRRDVTGQNRQLQVVVWVDPLDGTSEVALALKNKDKALLEQVTVLIGVAYKQRAVAGIIHQPYFNNVGRTIWAIEGCGINGIVPATNSGT